MDSIKWKCKNWRVYFKKFDNFHLIHLNVEKLDVSNFHSTFCYCYHKFHTHLRELNAFFKKIYIKSGKITEKKNKTLTDFWYLLISKCSQNRIKLNSVRSLWLCGKKTSHWMCSVKRCSQKFRRKTPVPELLFLINLQASQNFLEHFLLENTSGWLLPNFDKLPDKFQIFLDWYFRINCSNRLFQMQNPFSAYPGDSVCF